MTTLQKKPSAADRDARRSRVEGIYALLSGGSERACADMPPAECTDLPRNYVRYVMQLFPEQPQALGLIGIAAGLAAALSSPFWGRFADWSSRKVRLFMILRRRAPCRASA